MPLPIRLRNQVAGSGALGGVIPQFPFPEAPAEADPILVNAPLSLSIEATRSLADVGPPTFGSIATVNTASVLQQMTIGCPTAQAGDLLILAMFFGGNPGVIVPPPGFTLLTNDPFTPNPYIYTKIADGTETPNLIVSWATARPITAACLSYANVNSVGPLTVVFPLSDNYKSEGLSTSHSTPSVVPRGKNNAFILLCFNSSGTVTIPAVAAGWVERTDIADGSRNLEIQDYLTARDSTTLDPISFTSPSPTTTDYFLLTVTPKAQAGNRQLPVDARLGVAGTGSEPWDAKLGLSSTTLEPFEATGGATATATSTDSWEALRGILQSTLLPWESRVAITQSCSEVIEAGLGIASTESVQQEALKGIAVPAATAELVPAFRDVTIADGGAVNLENLTISKPALIQPGDMLVLFFRTSGAISAISAPGFTELIPPQTNYYFYWKIAGASEPSDYTITWTGMRIVNMALLAYSGVAEIEGDFSFADDGSRTNNHATGTFVVPTDNEGLLMLDGNGDHRAVDNISGWTERLEALAPASLINLNAQDLLAANSAGLKGPFAFTSTDSVQCQMFLFALRPPVPILSYESTAPTTSAEASLPFEALLGIAATTSEPWDFVGIIAVQQTCSLSYESLLRLASVSSLPWDVPPGVLAIAALVIDAKKKHAKTSSLPWEARPSLLQKTAAMVWENLRGHPTPRSQTVTHRWEALIGRKQTSVSQWEARGWLFKTLSLPWSSRAKLTANQATLAYESLVKHVRRPDDAPWEALKLLKRDDVDLPWDALGTPPPHIIGTALLAWESLKALEQIATDAWESDVNLRATAPLPWETPPGVIASAEAAYEALAGRQKTPGAPIEWEGRIAVGTAAAMVWDALEAVLNDIEFPWEAESTTGGVLANALLFLDSVANRSQTEQGAWEAGGGVGRAASVPWETQLATLTELLALFWEATSPIQEARELALEAEGRAANTARFPWESILLQFPGFVVSTIIAGAIAEGGTIGAAAVEGESASGTAVDATVLAQFIALAAVLAAFASTITDEEAGT